MTKVEELVQHVNDADAIVVGAGSGMSNAAGMNFWYEASPLFMKHVKYYYDKYHFQGLFNGFYNHFDSDVKGGFKLLFYGGLKMYDLGGLRID